MVTVFPPSDGSVCGEAGEAGEQQEHPDRPGDGGRPSGGGADHLHAP